MVNVSPYLNVAFVHIKLINNLNAKTKFQMASSRVTMPIGRLAFPTTKKDVLFFYHLLHCIGYRAVFRNGMQLCISVLMGVSYNPIDAASKIWYLWTSPITLLKLPLYTGIRE